VPFGLTFCAILVYWLCGILFSCCIQFAMYSFILSKTEVMLNSFTISIYLFYNISKYILQFSSYISSLLLFFILASLVSMVQFPLLHIKAARAGVFYNFILVFGGFLWSKHIVYNVRYFQTVICYQCPLCFHKLYNFSNIQKT
jgi:hypothetical protein